MTRYTVLWDTVLERHFIEAWTKSDSETRRILTDVANWVDSQLAEDPDAKGRPDVYDTETRILVVPSVTAQVSIVYRVLPANREVLVMRMLFKRATT